MVATRTPAADGALDRAAGCLVGLAVGDALGTTLEFKPRDTYTHLTDIVGGGPFRLKAGEWTDDTSMALCLADSLLERRRLDPLDLMQRFRRWRDEGHNAVNGRCFDIGITTGQAIDVYVATGNPLAGSIDGKAAGNGSIMRLAPVPIFYADDIQAAEAAAILQSRTTHGATECLDSCRLMTRILVALLEGRPWTRAIEVDPNLFAAARVKALASGTWQGRGRSQIKSSGYVIDTLEAALWAVDSTDDFASAVLLAVNLGGDADTVGAVTGQFAGARYGLTGIPLAWREKLAWYDRIAAQAQTLHRKHHAPIDGSTESAG
jgi:ADP-ribosyl-[dinitrogen reductase] hydrolase